MPMSIKMTTFTVAITLSCVFTLSNINLSNKNTSTIKTGEGCCILITNNSGTIEIVSDTHESAVGVHEKIGDHKSKIGKIN